MEINNMRDLESLRKWIVKEINKMNEEIVDNINTPFNDNDIYLGGKISAYKKTIKIIDRMIKEEQKNISKLCEIIDDLRQL